MRVLEQAFRKGSFNSLIRAAFTNENIRHRALPFIERKMWQALVERNPDGRPPKALQDKYDLAVALLHTADRSLNKGLISKYAVKRLFDTFLTVLLDQKRMQAKERLGFEPPSFITISPTQQCNLRCAGCYACSDGGMTAKLDWETFDRIIAEKEKLWGSYLTVISGGEPFLWKDNGWGFLDIIEKYPLQYFLVYTNGTLITKSVAQKMAELGNVTPSISLEGFEKQTDARRGRGVYKRILAAMDNLRQAKVPFGISVTATRENAELVASDAFVDFYFDSQGAAYEWIFQYMPIGRGHSLELMVTPEQRKAMFEHTWATVRQRKLLIVDFWNSGTATSGCISAARPGGYLYINWNGAVTPCVFIPYSTSNIYEIFKNGGDLNTILESPFFKKIRRWQDQYGYRQKYENTGNWLCPCAIRDHFEVMLQAVLDCDAKPIDNEAAAALVDQEYHSGMTAYGRDYYQLSEKTWNEKYLAEALLER